MKIAINYADEAYKKAQNFNTKTAYAKGNVDQVIEYTRDNIESSFLESYKNILNQKRGGGYWLWKPYIIKRTFNVAKEGDYIFYADSGSYYINSIDYLINVLNKENLWLMSFQLPFIEVEYTKRDIFEAFGLWSNKEKKRNQRLATFILTKKTKESENFFDEYLEYATLGSIITDSPSKHQPEDIHFVENRHDQSIFSMLCKKWKIPAFRDPSEYGLKPDLYYFHDNKPITITELEKSVYPQIMVSHRKKNPSKIVRIDAWLRRKLPISIYKKVSLIRDFLICSINRLKSIKLI